MMTVEEAKKLLFEQLTEPEIVETDISAAYGHVLAEDILAPIDLPIFDQSSVDGYALAFSQEFDTYKIQEEIKAGDHSDILLLPGQCVRLYTGAMVPLSANLVVMQEYVTELEGHIRLAPDHKPGNFIRKKGSHIRKGDPALEKGAFLNPGTVGFLASMGIQKLKTYQRPAVSIIVTGNEIIKPGQTLAQGQIYESNSFALIAALNQQQISPIHVFHALDNRTDLDKKLDMALKDSDMVLLTGGISVGKYDLVYDALMDAGAETIFYRVAQRPGKPLWAGKKDHEFIFALPGNPASVLVCFYEYVYPLLRTLMGFKEANLEAVMLKLSKEINEPGERAAFLRAKINGENVSALEKQDSGMMMSFAAGNALIYVPKDKNHIAKDEMVEVHLLPFGNSF